MKACRNAVDRLMLWLVSAAAVLLGVSTILATVNAFCRKFLLISIPWSEELCTYCVVIAVFLVIPYLELKDKQLSIGLLGSVVKSQKFLKVVFLIRGVFITLLGVIIVKFGINSTQAAHASNVMTYVLKWPKSIFFAIAVGCFALAIISWISIFALNKGDKFE